MMIPRVMLSLSPLVSIVNNSIGLHWVLVFGSIDYAR